MCSDLLTQAQHHVARARKIDEQERQLREKQEQERELVRQRQQLEAEQKAKEKEQQLQQLEEQRQQFKLKTQNLLQFKEEPEHKKKSKVNHHDSNVTRYHTRSWDEIFTKLTRLLLQDIEVLGNSQFCIHTKFMKL